MAVNTRIILSATWVALMLVYLLGDVLRIFAGDFEAGEMMGMRPSQAMWLVAAVIMLIPIVMVVLSLTLPYPLVRWVTLLAAVFQVVFNLAGLPYKGAYDNFLIVFSFVFDAFILWQAWKWVV
jgi:hypothetical protein